MDPKVQQLMQQAGLLKDEQAFDEAFETNEQAMKALFDKFPGKPCNKAQDEAIAKLLDGLGIDPKANRKEALKQELEDKAKGGPGPWVFNGVILPGARVNRRRIARPKRRKRKQPKPIRRLSEYSKEELDKLKLQDPTVARIEPDWLHHFGYWRGGVVELDSRGRPCPQC